MAKKISGSVGKAGKNSPADVKVVQELLNANASKIAPLRPLGVDGKVGAKTIGAIEAFQKRGAGMVRLDGRVDANGRTWKALVAGAGPAAVKPPVVSPVSLTLTVSHGGKIPTKTKFKETTPATVDGMYESTITISGGLTGTFRGSIYPDDMTVKGRVVDGTYPLHIGFHKGGGGAKQTAADLVVKTQGIRAGLLVNARSGVTVESDNPSKTTSHGINVHNGFNSSRGSDGCITIRPSDWTKFIQLFLDAYPDIKDWHTVGNNTGKKVGSLVILA